MKKYDFLIVGAGLFGSTIARLLADSGKRCLIIDKRNHVGGNIVDEVIDGILVHKYGAHIFHTNDDEVWNFVNRFSKFNNYINSPIAKWHDEIYNLPFNMNTFYQMFHVSNPQEVLDVIRKTSSRIKNPINLEEQAISLVGEEIYNKLIKDYTEKQWGRKCSELPASIIKRLPLRFIFDNNYFNAKHQGIPINGYSEMVQKMIDGIDVILDCDFKTLRSQDVIANRIIYTGKIDEYFDYCLGKLEYRSLRFETERIEVPNFQGVAVMNFTSHDVEYTRIIEHKHFTQFGDDIQKQKYTIVTKEYSQGYDGSNEAYYPIRDDNNISLYERYFQLNLNTNVIFGGRLGSYKYADMDTTIRNAIDLTNNLLEV